MAPPDPTNGTGYGYIRISRKLYETDDFWLQPRVFSRHEAWEDLIQMAAWRDHSRMANGIRVELGRGEVLASIRFLADRWQWGAKKVRVFLDLLAVKMGRIEAQRETHAGTVYLLVNYDQYQSAPADEGTDRGTVGAQSGHKENTGKKGNTKKPKTSLPADWAPIESHRAKAAERHIDIEREAEKMRNWAEANDAKCVSWNARFHLWLDNARPAMNGQRATPTPRGEYVRNEDLPWNRGAK